MRISTKASFVFLSMPKSASTSVEKALKPHCEIAFEGPGIKHLNARKYHDVIKPMLKALMPNKTFETICLYREPISFIHSWYRYR